MMKSVVTELIRNQICKEWENKKNFFDTEGGSDTDAIRRLLQAAIRLNIKLLVITVQHGECTKQLIRIRDKLMVIALP